MVKKRIIGFILLFFVAISIGFSSANAADSDLTFRLSQLESEVSNLRSQISRLQYQGSRSKPVLTAPERATAQTPRQTRPKYSEDPMFDRLATLLVELKEQVRSIDTRLSKVESRVLPKP